MESSDLFSHPHEAQAVPTTESSSGEVQLPAFSDSPQSATPTPPPS